MIALLHAQTYNLVPLLKSYNQSKDLNMLFQVDIINVLNMLKVGFALVGFQRCYFFCIKIFIFIF